MKLRKEFDSIGSVNVPNDKYWGASTQRSNKFFNIGKILVNISIIKSIAIIKRSAAIVHAKDKLIDKYIENKEIFRTIYIKDKIINVIIKELTNLSKHFNKLSEEASSVQQRLEALYEDMGGVLGRYYELNETHTDGHESDDIETPEMETGEENPYQEPISNDEITEEDTKYAKFFSGALKKFGVSSPAELGDKKKEFFNYVDKNYSAENETD